GGRILTTDVGCSSAPSATDNTKGELWVTAPLSSTTTFTGEGGISIYTQTADPARRRRIHGSVMADGDVAGLLPLQLPRERADRRDRRRPPARGARVG